MTELIAQVTVAAGFVWADPKARHVNPFLTNVKQQASLTAALTAMAQRIGVIMASTAESVTVSLLSPEELPVWQNSTTNGDSSGGGASVCNDIYCDLSVPVQRPFRPALQLTNVPEQARESGPEADLMPADVRGVFDFPERTTQGTSRRRVGVPGRLATYMTNLGALFKDRLLSLHGMCANLVPSAEGVNHNTDCPWGGWPYHGGSITLAASLTENVTVSLLSPEEPPGWLTGTVYGDSSGCEAPDYDDTYCDPSVPA
jgi:hypothetical protein